MKAEKRDELHSGQKGVWRRWAQGTWGCRQAGVWVGVRPGEHREGGRSASAGEEVGGEDAEVGGSG